MNYIEEYLNQVIFFDSGCMCWWVCC